MTEQNPVMEETAKTIADVREAATVMFQKLQELASEHGEQAIELALAVARVDALSNVIVPTVLLLSTFIYWSWWHKYPRENYERMREVVQKRREDRGSTHLNADEEAIAAIFWVPSILGIIVTLIFLGMTAARLWAWVGVFYPELWLAKKAMEQVL